MPSSAVIYTQLGCPYSSAMKRILAENNIAFFESLVGRDIIQEDFTSLFPGYSSQSVVAIGGNFIGGYRELNEWVNNRPQLLTE